jgi:hypothetical protein
VAKIRTLVIFEENLPFFRAEEFTLLLFDIAEALSSSAQ